MIYKGLQFIPNVRSHKTLHEHEYCVILIISQTCNFQSQSVAFKINNNIVNQLLCNKSFEN